MNTDPDSWFTTIASIAIVIHLICSVPLQVFPAAGSLRSFTKILVKFLQYVFCHRACEVPKDSKILDCVTTMDKRLWLYASNVAVCILSCALALFFQRLEVVLVLVGATGSGFISYILPAGLYLGAETQLSCTAIFASILGGVGAILILLYLVGLTVEQFD